MKIKKLGIYFIVSLLVVVFASTQVFSATVGEKLLEPESGWKRIDDTDSRISYSSGVIDYPSSDFYNGGCVYFTNSGEEIKFKFSGNKLRIIGNNWNNYSKNIKVIIDNQDYIMDQSTDQSGVGVVCSINFEKTDLSDNEHSVIIKTTDSLYCAFDAIDIDENGELLDMNTPDIPVNLTATSGDEKVILSWDEVKGADKYIVKRSTTKGGPYEKIGETKETSYTDSRLENGTTYYYVVCTVKNGLISPNSKEASATPEGSSGSGDNALLRITMTNGKINEYDLSMSDVEDFIDWYEDRADDRGKPYYIIEKDYNIGPFESRKDYIVADKILQFEVMEYND